MPQNRVQRGRNLRSFRRARARLRRLQPAGPCWLCGQPIDPTLDYRDPRAWTADHVTPLNIGGAPTGELRPAHRACNSRRGDTTRAQRPVDNGVGSTSRNW